MYFHMAQPGSTAAYPAGCTLSEAIVAAAPKDIDLVYWDYYTEDGALARHLFAEHARFSADTLFAGGVYTWNGPVPDYDKAEATTRVLMTACREAGVRQAFATMWGDDGAECSRCSAACWGFSSLRKSRTTAAGTTTRWTRGLKPARAALRSPSARWARSTASGLTRGRAT